MCVLSTLWRDSLVCGCVRGAFLRQHCGFSVKLPVACTVRPVADQCCCETRRGTWRETPRFGLSSLTSGTDALALQTYRRRPSDASGKRFLAMLALTTRSGATLRTAMTRLLQRRHRHRYSRPLPHFAPPHPSLCPVKLGWRVHYLALLRPRKLTVNQARFRSLQ